MIGLTVFEDDTPDDPHFMVWGDEPHRAEYAQTNDGKPIVHIYRSDNPDPEQEPIGMYDGTLPKNESWVASEWDEDEALSRAIVALRRLESVDRDFEIPVPRNGARRVRPHVYLSEVISFLMTRRDIVNDA